jgi:steroid delta-isomerase-like uncharacterized protein
MAATDNKQVARQLLEGLWSQGNLQLIDQLCDPGYSAHVPLVGRVDQAGLKQAVGLFRKAFPDLRLEVKDILAEGDKVAVHWTGTGTSKGELMGYPPNGKTASVHGLSVLEIKDGRIVRDWSEFDVVELMQSLGVQVPIAAPQARPQPEVRH